MPVLKHSRARSRPLPTRAMVLTNENVLSLVLAVLLRCIHALPNVRSQLQREAQTYEGKAAPPGLHDDEQFIWVVQNYLLADPAIVRTLKSFDSVDGAKEAFRSTVMRIEQRMRRGESIDKIKGCMHRSLKALSQANRLPAAVQHAGQNSQAHPTPATVQPATNISLALPTPATVHAATSNSQAHPMHDTVQPVMSQVMQSTTNAQVFWAAAEEVQGQSELLRDLAEQTSQAAARQAAITTALREVLLHLCHKH